MAVVGIIIAAAGIVIGVVRLVMDTSDRRRLLKKERADEQAADLAVQASKPKIERASVAQARREVQSIQGAPPNRQRRAFTSIGPVLLLVVLGVIAVLIGAFVL